MTKVLIVVARRYNGHELWTTLGVLQQQEIDFHIISAEQVIKDEITAEAHMCDGTIADFDPQDFDKFDGLMVISGNMKDTEAYWKHPKVLELVDLAYQEDLPIAAICCSVPTIRSAAKGKRVSYFPLVRSRELLEKAGAILQTVACTVDQKLVTAEHQMATQTWAGAFCDVLNGMDVDLGLVDSGFRPAGRPRMPIPEIERLKKPEDREVVRKKRTNES